MTSTPPRCCLFDLHRSYKWNFLSNQSTCGAGATFCCATTSIVSLKLSGLAANACMCQLRSKLSSGFSTIQKSFQLKWGADCTWTIQRASNFHRLWIWSTVVQKKPKLWVWHVILARLPITAFDLWGRLINLAWTSICRWISISSAQSVGNHIKFVDITAPELEPCSMALMKFKARWASLRLAGAWIAAYDGDSSSSLMSFIVAMVRNAPRRKASTGDLMAE